MSTTKRMILSPGQQVAGFLVVAPIAAGGMAVVYEAEQTRLKRRVALKVLNERLGRDDSYRERFIREGTHIAALEHPNIVPVYDAGEHDGRLFIAMRFVDGETLGDRLADRHLSPAEVHSILGPIGRALDAAHNARIIHRDIKPGNILIDSQGNPFLADFGIARAATATHTLTTAGSFVGSVHYAAPEQARGEAPTPASDIYSLTIVYYQCITGEVPFRSDTESTVLDAHLNAAIPEIPEELGGTPELNAVIAKGMSKDPMARYETAGDLADAVEAALTPPKKIPDPVPPPPVDTTGESPHTPHETVTPKLYPVVEPVDAVIPSDPQGTVVVESTTVDPRDDGYQPPAEPKPPRFQKSTLVLIGCAALALLLPTAAIAVSSMGGSSGVQTDELGLTVPKSLAAASADKAKALGINPDKAVVFKSDDSTVAIGAFSDPPKREGGLPPSLAKQFTGPPKSEAVQADGSAARKYTATLKKGPLTSFTGLVFVTPRGTHMLAACVEKPGSDACAKAIDSVDVKSDFAPIAPTTAAQKGLTEALAGLSAATKGVSLKTSNVKQRGDRADKLAEHYGKAGDAVSKIEGVSPAEKKQLKAIAATLRAEATTLKRLATASRKKKYAEYAAQKKKLARYQQTLRRQVAAF
jgi:serine/threonine protein kinase